MWKENTFLCKENMSDYLSRKWGRESDIVAIRGGPRVASKLLPSTSPSQVIVVLLYAGAGRLYDTQGVGVSWENRYTCTDSKIFPATQWGLPYGRRLLGIGPAFASAGSIEPMTAVMTPSRIRRTR